MQVVRNGKDALDYLKGEGRFADRGKHPLPFLAFIDLKLPYVNGFEVLEWMRGRPEVQSIVPVVLTSSNEDRDHQKAYTLGARSYLVKPPSPEDLNALMDSLRSLWEKESGAGPVRRAPKGTVQGPPKSA
jgi:CheY-like chemotaxis protein